MIKRLFIAAVFAVLLSVVMSPAVSASQPTITKITVENLQYPAGTIWHTENVWSRFENTLSSGLYGDWDNSNTDDNCISGLDTTENVIYAGKTDNTGNCDNVEWVLTVPFNENLVSVNLLFWYKTAENTEAQTIYLKKILENTSGDNIQLGTTLDVTAQSGWYNSGFVDFTDQITAAGVYKLKLRVEMQDTGASGTNIKVLFDNFLLQTTYRGSSDNITISSVRFHYTPVSLTSTGTVRFSIEENFTVTADSDITVAFTFDPYATGKTWDNVIVNGSNQTFSESNENVSWSYSLTANQVENVELLYHTDITFDNWATVQSSSQHQIGVDDNVEFTASVDVASDSPLDNLTLTISLPDPATLKGTENVQVSGNYVPTSASGENLTFTITKVENENSFSVLYAQSPASYSFVGVSNLNGDLRRYTWTLTNPTAHHTFVNCKFSAVVSELTNRVEGTEEVTWGGTSITAYTISGSTFSVDPNLSPGDTTLTLDFERQHSLFMPPPGSGIVTPQEVAPEEEVPEEAPQPSVVIPPVALFLILFGLVFVMLVVKRR